MARLPRLSAPGELHWVLWRGHNRQPVFLDDTDRTVFLACLRDALAQQSAQLHAYVLLDNEVHLLLTPTAEGALATAMQTVGRAYVRRFNQRHGRSGTLWEGRYRSTVVEAALLLPVMVCLDHAPVRAGLVPAPEPYGWSSLGHYLGWRNDGALLQPHPDWWALGNTPFAREAAYAERVRQGLGQVESARLTQVASTGWALGSAGFLRRIEALTGRRAAPARPGRPRKVPPAAQY